MVHIEQPKDIFFQLINGNVTLCSFAEPNYPFGLFNNNMKNDRYKLPLSLSLTLRWYIRNIYNVVVASHTRADRIKIFNSSQKTQLKTMQVSCIAWNTFSRREKTWNVRHMNIWAIPERRLNWEISVLVFRKLFKYNATWYGHLFTDAPYGLT